MTAVVLMEDVIKSQLWSAGVNILSPFNAACSFYCLLILQSWMRNHEIKLFFNKRNNPSYLVIKTAEAPQHVMEIHLTTLCKHTLNHKEQWNTVVFSKVISTLNLVPVLRQVWGQASWWRCTLVLAFVCIPCKSLCSPPCWHVSGHWEHHPSLGYQEKSHTKKEKKQISQTSLWMSRTVCAYCARKNV